MRPLLPEREWYLVAADARAALLLLCAGIRANEGEIMSEVKEALHAALKVPDLAPLEEETKLLLRRSSLWGY